MISVSRMCDQDMVCISEKDHARVVDEDGIVVARFNRDGGLYACTMILQRPEARNDPDFVQHER